MTMRAILTSGLALALLGPWPAAARPARPEVAVPALPVAPEAPVAPTAPDAADAAYLDVLAAINAGDTLERSIDTMARTMAQQLAVSSPAMIEAEAGFPGLSAAMADAIKPVLVDHTRRLQIEYRPQMIAALQQHLTPPQAVDVADFFRSPLGRKLMTGMASSYDGKATMASAMSDKDVTQEALETDTRVSARRTLATFSQAELIELGQLAKRKPHLMKMKELGESLQPVRLEMENAPLSAEEEQRMDAAIRAAADKIMGPRKQAPTPAPPPAPIKPEKARGTIEGSPRA